MNESVSSTEMGCIWLVVNHYADCATHIQQHRVTVTDFTIPDCVHGWTCIEKMLAENTPIAEDTFKVEFLADGKHDQLRLLDLMDNYILPAHAEFFFGRLKDLTHGRDVSRMLANIQHEAKDKSPGEIIDMVQAEAQRMEQLMLPENATLMKWDGFKDRIISHYNDPNAAAGQSTGWPVMDEFFKHKPGNLVIVTGIPGSGKSEWLDMVMVKAIQKHRWKWVVFSPENYPPEFHFQKLAEKYMDSPMFAKYGRKPLSPDDINRAITGLSEYVTIVTPEESGLTIDKVLAKFRLAKQKYGINAAIIDPYNEVEHKRAKNVSEVEYQSEFLSRVRNFGRLHDIEMFVVAHPTKMFFGDDGEYRVPNMYDISGSAHWNNKADIGISVWRSFQRQDNLTNVHILKVRDKNIGKRGKVVFDWDYITGVYTPHIEIPVQMRNK